MVTKRKQKISYKHRRLAKIVAQVTLAGKKVSKQKMAEMAGLSQFPNSEAMRIAMVNLGFTVENAKRVVGEILNNAEADDNARLKSAELVFKVHGAFAPDKVINMDVSISDVLDAIDKRERGD